MLIINTKQFKTSQQVWDEFYKIYYNLTDKKNHVELILDELKDRFYGCTPFFEEAMQIFETKFGRSWDEIMKPLTVIE